MSKIFTTDPKVKEEKTATVDTSTVGSDVLDASESLRHYLQGPPLCRQLPPHTDRNTVILPEVNVELTASAAYDEEEEETMRVINVEEKLNAEWMASAN
jgi:hypothetical protein